MKYYKQMSKIRNGAPTSEVGVGMRGEIIVGKFVDRERPDYSSLLRNQMTAQLGDAYVEAPGCSCD
jgi:2-oxoglutarate ferredoxin oxidoreductase subunit beta